MKLLSWMHRKLQKDATSSLQASVGNSCTYLLVPPSTDSRQIWKQKQHCQDPVEEINPENTEEFNEEQSTDIFLGFLTIGTLSVEPISEPPTPTFDLPHQVTNEEAMKEMKYDLKLINEELEKFLKVEAEKVGSTDSSRKNSHASTITLGDEVKEDAGDQGSIKTQLYPLQGYLLGSSTELLEETPKEKKEKTLLYERLKKSMITDRRSIKASDRTQKEDREETKSSNRPTNKMQQPTEVTPHGSNHSAGQAAVSFPTLRKLKKINRLFHKKIHPEISKAEFAAKEPKSSKYETKKIYNTSNSYEDLVLRSGKSMIGCWGALRKGKKHCPKSHMKLPRREITNKHNFDPALEDTSCSTGKEHWIRTDEEYFVLELQQNEGVRTSGLKVIYI